MIDGEVLIVDEHTGASDATTRACTNPRARKVEIKDEYQTLATITLQNYFRMYDKLSGMTGTAKTEDEFQKVYGLGVLEIPTNKPMIHLQGPVRPHLPVGGCQVHLHRR